MSGDWSTLLMLASDWSTVLIIASDWSTELYDEISEVVMSEPGDIVIGPQYGVYPPVDSILPSDITVR